MKWAGLFCSAVIGASAAAVEPFEKRANAICFLQQAVIKLMQSSDAAQATNYCQSAIATKTTVTVTSTPVLQIVITPTSIIEAIATAISYVNLTETLSTVDATTVSTVVTTSVTTATSTGSCPAPPPTDLKERAVATPTGWKAALRQQKLVRPTPAPLKPLGAAIVKGLCSCIATGTTSTSIVSRTAPTSTHTTTTSPVSITTTQTIQSLVTTVDATQFVHLTATSTTTTVVPSTVVVPPPRPYCSGGDIMGTGLYQVPYTPQCDQSYVIEENSETNTVTYTTVASYQGCLNACDNDGFCYAFSFLKNVCSDNCLLMGASSAYPGPPPGAQDPNVDSGVYNPNAPLE